MTKNIVRALADLVCIQLKEINTQYEECDSFNLDFFSLFTGEKQKTTDKSNEKIAAYKKSLEKRAKVHFLALKDLDEELAGKDIDNDDLKEMFKTITPSLLHIYDEVFTGEKDA